MTLIDYGWALAGILAYVAVLLFCNLLHKVRRMPKPRFIGIRQRRDNRLLRDAARLTKAPYTYWCPMGQHTWSLYCMGSTQPPAMDGATVNCVAHACTYSVDDDEA